MKVNFEKIKEKYVALYHECLDFIVDPNKGWGKVVEERRSWTDTQTRLLYPLLVLICVCGFIRVLIENFYDAEYDLLTQVILAFAWPVFLAVSLIVTALFTSKLFNLYINKIIKIKFSVDFERMVVFLMYAEIPLFLSAAIMALMPFTFAVLVFLNFYAAFIIMSGYNVYFADIMGEERKYNYITTLITFGIIYAFTYGAWIALGKI